MAPTTEGGGLWVKEPLAVEIINNVETMVAGSVVFAFIALRWTNKSLSWRKLPYNQWMIFGILGSSWLYIFIQTIFATPRFGLNEFSSVCEAATFTCLALHLWSKVFLFMYLIERAEVVRGVKNLKFTQSKLKMFNAGMMFIYSVWIILYFVFRIAYVENGLCIIGVQRKVLIPTVVTEVLLNTYLTVLFVGPVLKSSKFNRGMRQRPDAKMNVPVSPHDAITTRLENLAKRSFWGSAIAQVSMLVNLGTLIFFEGEPAWLCLLCCKTDILICAIAVYWMVSSDNLEEDLSKQYNSGGVQSRTGQLQSATRTGPYGYANGYGSRRREADEEQVHPDDLPERARMSFPGAAYELSPVSRTGRPFQTVTTVTTAKHDSTNQTWEDNADAKSTKNIFKETSIYVEREDGTEKYESGKQGHYFHGSN